jgi:hypothetical protein
MKIILVFTVISLFALLGCELGEKKDAIEGQWTIVEYADINSKDTFMYGDFMSNFITLAFKDEEELMIELPVRGTFYENYGVNFAPEEKHRMRKELMKDDLFISSSFKENEKKFYIEISKAIDTLFNGTYLVELKMPSRETAFNYVMKLSSNDVYFLCERSSY